MTSTVTKTEMRIMLKKLEKVELELLWMKEKLLSKAKLGKREKAALDEARKEMAKGEWISGRDLIKRLG